MCRRATGGPFAVLVWFPAAAVQWTAGAPAAHRSSPIAERGFCATCGTPLYLRYDGAHEIAMLLGTLEHPEQCAPQYHYGIEGRLPWVDCGPGLNEKPTQEKF